jgi:dUTP pyrophosphatase
MKVKIINKSTNPLPNYATAGSAGVDLYANLGDEIIILEPLERFMIPTGIFIELPVGYEAQVRPRSGLAAKHGISIVNTPGTVDSDYRGEIKIILINLSNKTVAIKHGERIGQMIISKHETAEWNVVDELSTSQRGSGGFGHTGV